MTLDEALEQALGELDLDRGHRAEVREMATSPRGTWRPCCGSLCDPCVMELHRAADRVRELCPDASG